MLHIDIETYSSVDLKTCGVYNYAASDDFEILCIAWSYGQEVKVAQWCQVPYEVLRDIADPQVKKAAHNANFERICLNTALKVNTQNWYCTAVLAGYNGLPMSLAGVTSALGFTSAAKSLTGAALIRYFCMPCKPTKTNEGRTRNHPSHYRAKWQAFLDYCRQDVVSELAVYEALRHNGLTATEQEAYIEDQRINDRGILIDIEFVKKAIALNEISSKRLTERAKYITGLDNPNSPAQLKKWLTEVTGENITTLTKESLASMQFSDARASELISLRSQMSKTSIKKYEAMLKCAGADNRARGLLQFYGASRTGRWAGRLIQMQNLPRNYMEGLADARKLVCLGDYMSLFLMYDDIPDLLSQLIRTSFISATGTLAVVDYSAIEARVLSWLAGENWRLEVFRTHGKIYEASAAQMLGIDISEVTKNQRSQGKIAELALGYQGGVGALKAMGAEKMGLTASQMQSTVDLWRKANPSIINYWSVVGYAAKKCLLTRQEVELGSLVFSCAKNGTLYIQLPSGRKLAYYSAVLNGSTIKYKGVDTYTKKWGWIDTYGGKLVENITQAVARDILSEALLNLSCYSTVIHVHDEVVIEAEASELSTIKDIMQDLPVWTKGFPQACEGYTTEFYKKD